MNDKFPILNLLSKILKLVGWVLVLPGLYFAIYEGIIEPNQSGHVFGSGDAIELGVGSLMILFGLITAAFGEVIGVLFSIELNTRK